MKMNGLLVFGILGLSVLSTGCNDRYQEGYNLGKTQGYDTGHAEGYEEGYDEGYDSGYNSGFASGDIAGYERARVQFQTGEYAAGYAAGYALAEPIGYQNGYNPGRTAGIAQGIQNAKDQAYDEGYDIGYNEGDAAGYSAGYSSGYSSGYSVGSNPNQITTAYNNGYDDGYEDGYAEGDALGYRHGSEDGYDDGYDLGWDEGYDVGYDDGWDDALGLSVRPLKTNSSNLRVNLLSRVHNDLVNVRKIKAPKSTSRGLEVNGRMIFEETSMSSKDLEKRAAVAERYLVTEMGKQIQAKFGLSAERSLKVAKISNFWRKYSTARAVTSDDADAFSEQLIGVNLKTVHNAVVKSSKGNVTELNALLKKAAQTNETSPEKMALIMTKLFF